MRIAEKTVELNYCAQLSRRARNDVIWFSLTQKQEARAGFDTCTKLGGRLVVFQFKASNQDIRNKSARRFTAKHAQLTALRIRCRGFFRSVFYAFPLIGNTLELSKTQDFLSHTWLLDVQTLPPVSPPTRSDGHPRKSGVHYVDVSPGKAVIRSDPVEVPLV